MNTFNIQGRSKAQESSNAIERMYITMRHLFNRGYYKPMGISGESLRESLFTLRPEIYGAIAEDKVELQGLLYVIDRLPFGIEECSYINLTSDEGYKNSHFKPIIPKKRRRNCYRIDEEQMNIEVTRGRSEIYDILTHLTFLYIESHKIMRSVLIDEGKDYTRDWKKLELAIKKESLTEDERETVISHVANFLGRSYQEVRSFHPLFSTSEDEDRFLKIIYFLGIRAIQEVVEDKKRIVTFSPVLRERLGHHIYGERWANNIKRTLAENNLLDREIHIISANMHSVMNSLFAEAALKDELKSTTKLEIYEYLSDIANGNIRLKVNEHAINNGMIFIEDQSGTNIHVQIFDTSKIKLENCAFKINKENAPVIIVMDYAFGEQAYETMDELLKPYKENGKEFHLDVPSISIMGKAGILQGRKGDIMIPKAHVFEGTADNYPVKNKLKKKHLVGNGINIYNGSMITVLGTSLQNREILRFFNESTWDVIGLEMEGAHYQKAIQAASKIRGNIRSNVKVRYAYYASDNPLETGSTLASGGLGTSGVKPTYLITEKILEQIFQQNGK